MEKVKVQLRLLLYFLITSVIFPPDFYGARFLSASFFFKVSCLLQRVTSSGTKLNKILEAFPFPSSTSLESGQRGSRCMSNVLTLYLDFFNVLSVNFASKPTESLREPWLLKSNYETSPNLIIE